MSQTSKVAQKALHALENFGVGSLTGMPIPGMAATIQRVLGKVFNNSTPESIQHLGTGILDKLQHSPTSLNPHLHALFVEDVQLGIAEGLASSYEKERNSTLDPACKALLEKLGAAFAQSFQTSTGDSPTISNLASLLDENNNFDAFLELMPDEYDPATLFSNNNFPADFATYFRDNLLSVCRVLFTEGLNSGKQEDARLEYEQVMAEEIYKSIQTIQQDLPNNASALGKASASTLASIQEAVANTIRQSLSEFEARLVKQLQLAKDTNQRVTRIEGKADSIQQGVNKGIKLSYLIISILAIMAAFLYFFHKNKTFHATVELRDEGNNAITQGDIYLEYGTKKEKVYLNKDGTAIFTQIPAYFENDSAEIILGGELEKKYAVLPANKKISLLSDRIVHVRVINKPDTSKKVEGGNTGGVPKPSGNSKNNTPIKREVDPPMPPEVMAKLNGITFADDMSPDKITFTSLGSSTFSFNGKVGIRPISGTMRFKEGRLEIVSGNVRGNLNLLDEYTTLKGGVTIIETNTQHSIGMKSN